MKRDMELIRSCLMYIEENDKVPGFEDMPNCGQMELLYHLSMLREVDFVEGFEVQFDTNEMASVLPDGLTRLSWKGHEFLDAARDSTTWEKAKQTLKDTGRDLSSVSLAVMQLLLAETIKKSIGL